MKNTLPSLYDHPVFLWFQKVHHPSRGEMRRGDPDDGDFPSGVSNLRTSRDMDLTVSAWGDPTVRTEERTGSMAVLHYLSQQPKPYLLLHMDSPTGDREDELPPGYMTIGFPPGTPPITVHVNYPDGTTASFSIQVMDDNPMIGRHRAAEGEHDMITPSVFGPDGAGATFSINFVLAEQMLGGQWVVDMSSMSQEAAPAAHFWVGLPTDAIDAVAYEIIWKEHVCTVGHRDPESPFKKMGGKIHTPTGHWGNRRYPCNAEQLISGF